MAVGLEQAPIAIGIGFDARLLDGPDLALVDGVFLLTLAVMVGLSVWGRGLWKLLAALLGSVTGYGARDTAGLRSIRTWVARSKESPWLGLILGGTTIPQVPIPPSSWFRSSWPAAPWQGSSEFPG